MGRGFASVAAGRGLACPLPTGGVYAVTCGHRMIVALRTPVLGGDRTSQRHQKRNDSSREEQCWD